MVAADVIFEGFVASVEPIFTVREHLRRCRPTMPTPSELEIIVNAISSALGDGWLTMMLILLLFKKIGESGTALDLETV